MDASQDMIQQMIEFYTNDNTIVPLTLTKSKVYVGIQKADGKKCARCWNYSTRVGEDQNHPTICERCVGFIREMGLYGTPFIEDIEYRKWKKLKAKRVSKRKKRKRAQKKSNGT